MQQRAQIAADLAEPLPPPMPAMEEWLRTNHQAVLDMAEALADHREELLAATADPEPLAEAIDAAGANISRRPSRALASAVARALGLALGKVPLSQAVQLEPDSDLSQMLTRSARLRDEFNAVRDQQR